MVATASGGPVAPTAPAATTVRLDELARELATHIRAAEGGGGGGGERDADRVAQRMRVGLPALLDACLDEGTGEDGREWRDEGRPQLGDASEAGRPPLLPPTRTLRPLPFLPLSLQASATAKRRPPSASSTSPSASTRTRWRVPLPRATAAPRSRRA